LNLEVEVTPFQIGLNTITLQFTNDSKVKDVRIKLSMSPNWRIENKAFKVGEGKYKMTRNLLHGAGTINMSVKVVKENGEEMVLPYKIVVPGEDRSIRENILSKGGVSFVRAIY
jgi:copper transport protein